MRTALVSALVLVGLSIVPLASATPESNVSALDGVWTDWIDQMPIAKDFLGEDADSCKYNLVALNCDFCDGTTDHGECYGKEESCELYVWREIVCEDGP